MKQRHELIVSRSERSGRRGRLLALLVAALPAFANLSAAPPPDLRGDLRRIEDVRWRHRIWPAANPGPKPTLDAILPEAALRLRAARAGALVRALDTVWHRPLTAVQLQAEIDRMARETKAPAVLREMWAALGDDPARVARALVAPVLADHLARTWYASDPRLHAAVRERAERESAEGSGPRTVIRWTRRDDPAAFAAAQEWLAGRSDGALHEDASRFFTLRTVVAGADTIEAEIRIWPKVPFTTWLDGLVATGSPAGSDALLPSASLRLPSISGSQAAPAAAAPADDTWIAIAYTPLARSNLRAVWTGAEMLFWGGYGTGTNGGANDDGALYDPVTDRFRPVSTENAPEGRSRHSAVWTGTELVVWGGIAGGGPLYGNGGRYDPTADAWTPVSPTGAPSARERHSAVWTGTRMIVWGGGDASGNRSDGGVYDPATNTWTPTSSTGAPSARLGHSAVWTGSRMIVWGGTSDTTGGRYDPASDTWSPTATANAPQARSLQKAVWDGTRLIVWGGCAATDPTCIAPLATGGRYDPAIDAWSGISTAGAPFGRRNHSLVWTGTRAIVWGGCTDQECSAHTNTGGLYDPVADLWTPTSTATAPFPRSSHDAVWTGTEMVAWGGCNGAQCEFPVNTGGRYAPATDSWVPTFRPPAPTRRVGHSAVWTGSEMIVWGGNSNGLLERTGGRYDPATDSWSWFMSPGGIDARQNHTAVWTGTEMIVWGGSAFGLGATSSGGRYAPATDSWLETSQLGAPDPREQHVAVWTGTRMIVWGGIDAARTPTVTGGRYDPAADSWLPMTTTGAPAGSYRLPAAWSGTEMLVWAGLDAGLAPTAGGGRYDPVLDAWTAIPAAGAPTARSEHSAVWTGTELIVWGGKDAAGVLATGGRFSPSADAWRATATAGAPSAREGHTAVWTGTDMIVWGGCVDPTCEGLDPHPRDAARYVPATDGWRTVSGFRQPTPRSAHTAVWSGTHMLVWGGEKGTIMLDTGGAYLSAVDPPGLGEALGLVLAKNPDGVRLALSWGPSCSRDATDYEVQEGTLGLWTSHAPVLCSTAGATAADVTPAPGDRYFLIVPRSANAEGSYGTEGNGLERPTSSSVCVALQVLGGCP